MFYFTDHETLINKSVRENSLTIKSHRFVRFRPFSKWSVMFGSSAITFAYRFFLKSHTRDLTLLCRHWPSHTGLYVPWIFAIFFTYILYAGVALPTQLGVNLHLFLSVLSGEHIVLLFYVFIADYFALWERHRL